MRPPQNATEIELQVPFHDVDGMQIVWHGNYLKYFGMAREKFFRERHMDVSDVIAMGYAMVVIESRCRHNFPLRYGERARVRAWCTEVSHRIRIQFEVWNLSQNRRSARGSTTLAITTLEGDLQFEAPTPIAEALAHDTP